MAHYTYLLLMLLVAAPFLWKFRDRNLSLHRQLLPALLATLFVAVPFLIWDVLVTEAGHWAFSAQYTMAIRIINLPVEEVLFFLVVPMTSILVWETIGYFLRER